MHLHRLLHLHCLSRWFQPRQQINKHLGHLCQIAQLKDLLQHQLRALRSTLQMLVRDRRLLRHRPAHPPL